MPFYDVASNICQAHCPPRLNTHFETPSLEFITGIL
jgi:hypothetical protein